MWGHSQSPRLCLQVFFWLTHNAQMSPKTLPSKCGYFALISHYKTEETLRKNLSRRVQTTERRVFNSCFNQKWEVQHRYITSPSAVDKLCYDITCHRNANPSTHANIYSRCTFIVLLFLCYLLFLHKSKVISVLIRIMWQTLLKI